MKDESLRILIIEDFEPDAELALAALRRAGVQCDMRRVEAADALVQALQEFRPHLVLSDFSLPGFDGFSALEIVRRHAPDVPMVFVSGTIGEERAIESLKRGATDYVLKDHLERLPRAVMRAIAEARERRALALAQQEVNLNAERFKLILDHSFDAFVAIGDDGMVMEWSRQAQAIFGWRRDEVIGRKLAAELVPHEHRVRFERVMKRLLGGKGHAGRRREFEFVAERRGGEHFPAEARLVPIQMRDRLLLSANVRDVSERKRSEEMLRLRERAIESSLHAIVITSATKPDQPLEYVNAAFERITGYSSEESIGRNCRFLQRDDHDQPGVRLIAEALARGSEVHAVLQNYRKNGEMFWNEVHIAPVRDASGRITHFVGIQSDVTERVEHEARIEYLATHDELTGLPNRRLLEDRVEQALIHSRRTGRSMAIALLDIDRFKLVNDSRGHPFGDRLLSALATRLSTAVRNGDTVARQGGDEFIVLMTDLARHSDASRAVGKLQAALVDPIVVDGVELFVNASIGVSLYPDDGDSVEALLSHADMALYRAKDQGRDMVAFYTADMSGPALDRMQLEEALRHAISRGELTLHYQPQIALRSGRLLGVEALLRWRHPELGMVPPSRFIPVAEDTGLILPIGNWVIETACTQARTWADAGFNQLRIAVNLSPRQFRQHDLVPRIEATLERTGLPAENLELELTEGMLIEDPDRAEAVLRQLRTVGVRVAIDDFGTGYSSLSYLQRFVADLIKIDQSFVRTIISDPQSAAIARAVISLGHSLQLNVLAEGVETAEQLSFLREAGCDEAQGYLIAKPMPANNCSAFIENWKGFETRLGDDTPTLLVVDDDASILSALQRCLRREGYRILTTTNPGRAFELLASSRVDVVVSDCRMSGMSGNEFLDRVRQLHPATVRILLTGYTELTSVVDAVNRGGVFKFVTKPWDNEALRMTLRQAFRRYAQSQERRPGHATDDMDEGLLAGD